MLLLLLHCRDVAEAKQARRQQLATALTSWWLTTQRRAFDTWRDNVLEAIKVRQVCHAVHARLNTIPILSATQFRQPWEGAFHCQPMVKNPMAFVKQLQAWQHATVVCGRYMGRPSFACLPCGMWLQAAAHWQHRVLSRCLTSWRERVLVKQQYSIITRVVTNKRVNRLLLDAWTAWRVGAAAVTS
jgi:hypothetical protein